MKIYLLLIILIVLPIANANYPVTYPYESIACEQLDGDANGIPDGECMMMFDCMSSHTMDYSRVGYCAGPFQGCCINNYEPTLKQICPDDYYCDCVESEIHCNNLFSIPISDEECGGQCCEHWQIHSYGKQGCYSPITYGNSCYVEGQGNGHCDSDFFCGLYGGTSFIDDECSRLGLEVCCINENKKQSMDYTKKLQ